MRAGQIMGIGHEDTVREDATTAPAPLAAPAAAEPARPRRLHRLRELAGRVPRPLAALLGAVTIFGVAWALIIPPWQKVDEVTHFAYVQSLAVRGELPGSGPYPFSSAQGWSQYATNYDDVRVNPAAKPEWSQSTYALWKHNAPLNSNSDGGGASAASGYPPAYYLIEAAAYHLGDGGDITSHLYADRLVSALWLLLTTIGAWLLAGEVLGRRRVLQLVAAAAVGLWPMIDEISSDVDPDSMLYAEWTFVLWVGVRIIRHGLTVRRGLGLGALVGLSMVTKATSLALLPAAAFVLLYGLWRLRSRSLRRAIVALAVAVAVFAIPVGSWAVVTRTQHRAAYGQASGAATAGPAGTNWREFLSYVWQYYLPRLPFQHPVHFDNQALSSYPAYNVWVATSWAAFGWIDAFLPRWMYPVFLGITALVMLAAALKVFLVVRRGRGPPRVRPPRGTGAIAIFFALALFTLLAGLHWTEYHNRYPTNHGQYLFPLASFAGIALALAVSLAPRRRWMTVAGGLLGGLVVYQLLCLGFVAQRFYGLVS